MKLGRRVRQLEGQGEAGPGVSHPPLAPLASDRATIDPRYLQHLTAAERKEAERLWSRGRPETVGWPPRASWDLADLTCPELDRLDALLRRGAGLSPKGEPDYPYKGHFWRACNDCRGRCAGPVG